MTRTALTMTLALLATLALASAQAPPSDPDRRAGPATSRFRTVEVWIDGGDHPLAAYQVDVHATRGHVTIVGIEGGDHAAFKSPPYYDPRAMQHDRVIIAAFSTATDLPAGRTRIARIHVQVTGDEAPEYSTTLMIAATADGTKVPATVDLKEGDGK